MGKEFLNIVKKTVGNSLQRERERENEHGETSGKRKLCNVSVKPNRAQHSQGKKGLKNT